MAHEHSHRRFAIGVLLNFLFVIIEAGYGVVAGSLVLIADAGHNLSDVVSLLLAWGASALAARPATERRTYGWQKVTVMASLASATLLFVALGGIAWEALCRLFTPTPAEGLTIMAVAAVGVVINASTALLFAGGRKHDLNIRGAFLHMAADAGVSLGALVAGLIIQVTGRLWIDPLSSLVIVAVIFVGTWGLLRDSIDYALDAVPQGVDLPGIRDYLAGLDHVVRIHDLHVWPLSTTKIALTVHLVADDSSLDSGALLAIQQQLHQRFGIDHSTIQVEAFPGENACRLENDRCI